MLFIENAAIHDPSINLAVEEYILRQAKTDEDILMFYINQPSIIIGRHQNTIEEINSEYVEAQQIQVVRRLSGGGAVYHDLGNLNFSFITRYQAQNANNFKKFTEPVIKALNGMGVPAELSGRNDILVDGRKVSGNAQYITPQRMYSHGTLLFNTELMRVADALRVKASKIESKGIKSVRSRVANISEFLNPPMEMDQFKQLLLQSLFEGNTEAHRYPLSPEDWEAIQKLVDERYRNWNWNYGRSPDFNIQRTQRFPFGEIDARLDVQGGVIRSIRFFGDFFSVREINELEDRLKGSLYSAAGLGETLKTIDLTQFFPLEQEELVHFLY